MGKFWDELRQALTLARMAKCPECSKEPLAVGFDVQQGRYRFRCLEHGMWDLANGREAE